VNKLVRCGSYSRLSKEDMLRKDESSSISSQKMIINSFAKFNNLEIVEEYVDDGYSGGNFNRPAFQRMIQDIESGLINCVITKDLSRLGRELYKTGDYIEEYFTSKGVRYIAINDSYDSLIGDSMLGIRLGVNDLYLRDVSKKVKSSIRIKQESGEYIGSFAPYGYKKDPNDRHHLIIDEEAATVVRMMYQLALEGYGMNTICHRLTNLGYPIPIVYKNDPRAKNVTDNHGLGIWKHSTVKGILTSQMYIGHMVQHTYIKHSYRSKKLTKVDKDEYIIVKNTHDAIIDEETFNKVQTILKQRTTKCLHTKEGKYLFSGLLKCKECGATISISEKVTKKNNSHYTQCNLYRKKGKYGVCTQHRLNYNWLEEDLLDVIRNICSNFLNDYNAKEVVMKANDIYNDSINELKKEKEKCEIKINQENNIIDNLYQDKINRVLFEDDFKRLYEDHSSKIRSLKLQIENCDEKINKIEEEISNIDYKECKRVVDSFMSMRKPSRNIITRLVNRVEISEDKSIDVYFNFKELSCVFSK